MVASWYLIFSFLVSEGDNDSGVDESTQGNVSIVIIRSAKMHGRNQKNGSQKVKIRLVLSFF